MFFVLALCLQYRNILLVKDKYEEYNKVNMKDTINGCVLMTQSKTAQYRSSNGICCDEHGGRGDRVTRDSAVG
jgi:hypothetical protein